LSSIDELSTADNLIDLLSQTEIDNQTTSVPSTDSMDIVISPMVSSVHGPITHSVDKVPSSTPKTVSLSEDFIRASVRFRQIDTLKRNFSQLYQDTVKLDNTPRDAVLDSGDFATMQKKDQNTHPVQ
jgi:hypothetical protein